jgi:sulfide dehydrogenase cytochrome subunit
MPICAAPDVIGRVTLLVAGVVSAAMSAEAAPALAPPGASSCSGCHAPVARSGSMQPIRGRPADEIVAAMAEFRTGARAATVMDRIAKGFSDDETRAIAAWLAEQAP